jgi:AcrR family transcriptional regulator
MAQYRKDDVRERILEAALDLLADRGYGGCSVAEVARAAGLSVGNLYRYFPGKAELAAAALPPGVLARLRTAATGRLASLAEEGRAKGGRPEAPRGPEAGQVSAFAGRRRELLFLLDGAGGSPYEGFAERLKSSLVASFRRYERTGPAKARGRGGAAREAVIEAVYSSLFATFSSLLRKNRDPERLGEAITLALEYHLSGMKALLESKEQ